MTEKRRFWSDKEIRVLVRMFRRGKPDHEIASKLGRTGRSVSLKRYALGLRHEACPSVNREAKGRHRFARHVEELERLGVAK